MTLEESILFYEEQAKKCNNKVNQIILGAERCEQDKQEYTQLAEWLRELQERRKQPEVIHCGECRHYKPMSNHWGKCGVHSSPAEKYRTCQICDYCSWAERRTNDSV